MPRPDQGHNVERLRILLLIKSLGLGGAERLLVDSLPYLDHQRFSYQVAYLVPWKATLAPVIAQAGLPVHCLGRPAGVSIPALADSRPDYAEAGMVTPPRSLQAILLLPYAWSRLAHLHRRHAFHLIHADMPVAGILGRAFGRMHHVPVIYTEHNLQERYYPATRRLNMATMHWNAQVWAVSEEVAVSVRRHSPQLKTKLAVLPNGVPVEHVQREVAAGSAIRAELGFTQDQLVVGTIAVFRTQKRLLDWIDVAREVAAHCPKVMFLMVGDGPTMSQVRTQINIAGLAKRIHLVGFRLDGRRYLHAMDIFLMTSGHEGMPVALLEAMAMGKPVVATAVGGIPEVVREGETGFLAPVGACSQLADAVLRLLQCPEQRQRIGRQGAERIVAHYHIRRRVESLENCYAELCDQRVS